ncbi:sialate O-acetylesterase [Pontibacter actiniarum]|uniref:Sialate O-acetylesterase n=1 Tax=Pontibacter actiniarum TaxID=323450 RepID=A0A1X9YU86_9BACT|nr:sialate O-acetylesterase [Pontibacter actiniarum]ARS36423.1 sialate O-acetylesterase [Pontibacter actiniarum]
MFFKPKQLNLALLFFLSLTGTAFAQARLPKLIGDGMVLQRNAEVKIWGWAAPHEKVSVSFRNNKYKTVADEAGDWAIMLKDLPAGGPYTLKVEASNTITLNDILVGDVWVCSGQSNMELPMRRVRPLYGEEIANASNDNIRYFAVPQKYDFNTAREDLEAGQWQKTTPESVEGFSAVAYFFAKELHDKYKVPVGLINASLGGSPAEAWISEDALKAFPEHYQEAQRFKDGTLITRIEQQDNARRNAWYAQLNQKDKGHQGQQKWYVPHLNTSDWKTMQVPGYWADAALGQENGVVWFRKEVTLPASMAGKPADLNMGRIVDADSVFVNGQFVGTTGYQYPPRWYNVPAGVLKEGQNTIAIRIINESGKGGFVLDKPYQLTVGKQAIDLKGDWQYKLGAAMEPLGGQTFVRWKPTGLYNAMISPLLNYSIKGVIWYQGESNADTPEEYRTLFPALIRNWRAEWNQGEFPFLFVQLANYMEAKDKPSESGWAMLREAQQQALALPNTGMAVTIDLGEWNDIHPLRKKEVGQRLALAAEKVAYGDNVVHAGPTYTSMQKKGNKIILSFENTGSGLVAKGGGELKRFAIAGPDKQFTWAKAKIKGNKVTVWSDSISHPVAVRYAWSDNPEGANLYNKEGLPASPFRTDQEQAPQQGQL